MGKFFLRTIPSPWNHSRRNCLAAPSGVLVHSMVIRSLLVSCQTATMEDKGMFEKAKDKMGDMKDSVKDTAQSAKEKMTGTAHETREKAGDMAANARDATKDKLNAAGDKMRGK